MCFKQKSQRIRFNIYHYSGGYFSDAAGMKYLSLFSVSSNLLPVFNTLQLILFHILGTCHFKIRKKRIFYYWYAVKPGRKNIILRGEREILVIDLSIRQFPAEKSCQYFKWQFLLFKIYAAFFWNSRVENIYPDQVNVRLLTYIRTCANVAVHWNKNMKGTKCILKQWLSFALCIDWLSQ